MRAHLLRGTGLGTCRPGWGGLCSQCQGPHSCGAGLRGGLPEDRLIWGGTGPGVGGLPTQGQAFALLGIFFLLKVT